MKRLFFSIAFLLSSPLSLMAELQLEESAQPNLPQLNVATYSSQLFWLFISFLIFYVLVAWVFIPQIKNLLLYRRRHIEALLEEADIVTAKAERHAAQAKELINKSREEARNYIEQEKKALLKLKEKKIEEAEERFSKKTDIALAKIAEEKLAATLEVEKYASKLAGQIMKKLASDEVSEEDLQLKVKRYISEANREVA